jgi:hypothetical protein
MSEPKFKAGDPVWVKHTDTRREYPAFIIKFLNDICPGHNAWLYELSIEGFPGQWDSCEPWIRPRRDDYQQHEPLGSRADLTKPRSSIMTDKVFGEIVEIEIVKIEKV